MAGAALSRALDEILRRQPGPDAKEPAGRVRRPLSVRRPGGNGQAEHGPFREDHEDVLALPGVAGTRRQAGGAGDTGRKHESARADGPAQRPPEADRDADEEEGLSPGPSAAVARLR